MKLLIKSAKFFLIFTVICGMIFPLFITGISQICFKDKSNGSIIEINGTKYGSELLAQEFTSDKYLWGRVMNLDTSTFKNENGEVLLYSTPSNLSPASDEYKEIIKERVEKIKKANPEKGDEAIPVDLVTASGSGLDPHISVAAANYQIDRIARERNISKEEINGIIDKYTNERFLGVIGEETVNVLKVNLALDGKL